MRHPRPVGTGPALLAVAVAVGAVLTVAFVVLPAAAVFVVRPEGNDAAGALLRRVAIGCAAGGVALAASMLAWGPPPALRPAGLNGLSWIHPLSAAAGAAGVAVLALFAARWPDASRMQRGTIVGAAAVVGGGAVLAAMPGAVAHGLHSLRATDPWLRTITEFEPVLGSFGRGPELALLERRSGARRSGRGPAGVPAGVGPPRRIADCAPRADGRDGGVRRAPSSRSPSSERARSGRCKRATACPQRPGGSCGRRARRPTPRGRRRSGPR